MGRPRTYHEPRVATAVRLSVSLRSELRAAALERGISVNLLVTRAVSEYLRRLPPPEGQRPRRRAAGGRGRAGPGIAG